MEARSGTEQPALDFEHHEVITDSARGQTLLTGFLLDGSNADLATVHVDDAGERHLRIYSFDDGTWTPSLDASLQPEVVFVDVVNISGRDRLVTYRQGRLSWFDPGSTTDNALVDIDCRLGALSDDRLWHVDISRDLNSDGRDDLVVPTADGFSVLIQKDDGTFAEPVDIGGPSGASIFHLDDYRHDPWSHGRIHETDFNQDGRIDLVCWRDDHFEVYYQAESGLFASKPATLSTAVDFDTDDPTSLAAPREVRYRKGDQTLTGSTTGRILHSLSDHNGDGVTDLVVFSLGGKSLWSMHSTYEVHFGRTTHGGGVDFAPEASTVIESDGIPFDIGQHESDGRVDIMFTTINPGVFKMIGAFFSRSIALDLKLYRLDGGAYSDKPSARRRTRADSLGKAGNRTALFPSVLVGDVNGDDLSDLLVGRANRELHAYLGVEGERIFARDPVRVPVTTPAYEDHAWLTDINRDGKHDVLMHHQPITSDQGHVTVLVSR